MNTILVTFLFAAVAVAGPNQLVQSVPWFTLGTPNGAKMAAVGDRLFAGVSADDGAAALVIASTKDGVNWTQQTLPNAPNLVTNYALAGDGNTLAVFYQELAGTLKIQFCTNPVSGVCTWTGPYSVGTGITPSVALVNNTVYAAWSQSESIKLAIFPVGGTPVVTTVDASAPFTRNRMPSITGWWNTAAGKPVVNLYWHYSFAYTGTGPFSLWQLRRYSLDTAGVWSKTVRKSSLPTSVAVPLTAHSVATAVNRTNGAVTIAVSTSDNQSGPRTLLFNDTAEVSLMPGAAWITIDAVQKCNSNAVRIAVAPLNASTPYRRLYDRTTLLPAAASVLMPGAITPVASAWSRYVGGTPSASYTDYVEAIHGLSVSGLYDVRSVARHVLGLQMAPYCSIVF